MNILKAAAKVLLSLLALAVSLALMAVIVVLPYRTTADPAPTETVELNNYGGSIYIDGYLYSNEQFDLPITVSDGGVIYFPATDEMKDMLGIKIEYTPAGDGAPTGDPRARADHSLLQRWLSAVLSGYYYPQRAKDLSYDYVPVIEMETCSEFKAPELAEGQKKNQRLRYKVSSIGDCYVLTGGSFSDMEDPYRDLRYSWNRLAKSYYGTEGWDIYSTTGYHMMYMEENGQMWLPIYFFQHYGMGPSIYLDKQEGLFISTDSRYTAKQYFESIEGSYEDGLAQWILTIRKELDLETAQNYVSYFLSAAEEFNFDELLLMGVALNESRLTADIIGNGTIGMMQINPKYALKYGFEYDDLLNPKMAIRCAALYLDMFRSMYGEGLDKIFSAYSKGTGAVNAGNVDWNYANRILNNKETILKYLTDNGYSTEKKDHLTPAV